MSAMRKKSLAELMRDRASGNTDTSVYTEVVNKKNNLNSNKSTKRQVDNNYNKPTDNVSTWDKVQARVQNNTTIPTQINTNKLQKFNVNANQENKANNKKNNYLINSVANTKPTEEVVSKRVGELKAYIDPNKSADENIKNIESNMTNKERFEYINSSSSTFSSKYNTVKNDPYTSDIDKEVVKNISTIINDLHNQKNKNIDKKLVNIINNDDNKMNKSLAIAKYFVKELGDSSINSFDTIHASLKNFFGLDDNDELVKRSVEKQIDIQNRRDNIDNESIKTIGQGFSGVGGMLPQIASNLILPGSGNISAGVGSFSNEYANMIYENPDNIGKAKLTGLAKGSVTSFLEKITGSKISEIGSLDDIAINTISNNFKTNVGQLLASKGYEIGGEIVEEELENLCGYLIDKIINNKDITLEEALDDYQKTFKGTVSTMGILNLLGLGGDTYRNVKEINQSNSIDTTVDSSNLSDNQKEALKKVAKEKNISLEETKDLIYQSEQSTIENKQVLEDNQQVTQEQIKIAQNEVSEQIKKDSENFAKQVDIAKKGMFPQRDMLTLLSETPQALKDIGLSDLPITMTQKHLKTIMNESGQYKNANYHNLGEDIVKQLPEAISNPLDIVKSNTKEDSIVLTTYLANKQDNTVIASIKIDGKGQVNDIELDTNVMTSAYGKDNYENFMSKNLKENNLLYDIDRGVIKKLTRLGSNYLDTPTNVDTVENVSTTNNSISRNKENMQVQEKNKVELAEENARKLENKLKSEKYLSNESAKDFFNAAILNNLDISNEKVDALYDLPNARGIKAKIDTEIFKDTDGNIRKDINAVYTADKDGNRSIIYNPEANLDTIIEKNAIHETFHDMVGTQEGKDVIDYVYDRIKDSTEFMTASDSLRETYAKVKDTNGNILYDTKSEEFENMIKEEVVADYLGNNLGTQEYINELVNGKESRNIAQKIYDAIVSFLDKVTGYKSEEAYLRGLKEKFEKAFNTEYEGIHNIRFSINAELLDTNGNLKSFREQLEDKNFSRTSPYIISKDSLGITDNYYPITINPTTIDKIQKKHNISKEELYDLPNKLKDYMLVAKSQNREDSIIVFIDQVDNENRPIMVSIELDKKIRAYNINNVTSVYGRNNTSNFVTKLITDGNILKQGKKIKQWLQSIGVQFSKEVNNALLNTSIPQSNNNGNTNIKYSMQENKNNTENSNKSSFSMKEDNNKLSQNTKGKWEDFLEKHKINDGTRTALGEVKLPEGKRNLPTVQETQYQDAVNNATYIPKDVKTKLLSELDGVKKDIKSLREFESIVKEMDNTYKELDNDLLKKQTYNTGNKEIYQSHLKETKKYDMKAINNALNLVKPNSQGRRTKEQWTNIAKQIGTEISNKANKEIQEIAFRSWQDLRPNSKENLNRQGQKYVEFNSDDWVNTIYEQVEQSRAKFSINESKNNEVQLPKSKKIESNRTELPTNPEIYQDEDVRAFKYATDNIDNISLEDNFAPPKPPDDDLPDTKAYIRQKRTKQKVKPKEVIDSFKQNFVNKGHYIDKLSKQTKNNELKYKYDRILSTFNEAQYSIGKEQVSSKGEVVGESLLDIFKPIEDAKLDIDFEDYLLNKHNISRTIAGKSIYGDDVSAPQSKKIVEKYEQKYPQFKEWAEKVNKYNQNTLKDMADAGMISQETYYNLRTMYGDYVPTYRDIIDEKVIFDEDNKVGSNALGKATKSNLEILSPKEAMAEQTLAVKKAIRMNELGIELYKTLGKDSKIFEGIDFDASAIQTLGGEVIQKAQDGNNTFTVFVDGKMAQFKISDELYTAFSKDTLQARIQNNKALNAILTPVEKLSKVQRNLLTTYSIGFAINNPIKDIQDAVFNTKYSVARFGKNYVKALYQIGSKGNLYKQYVRDGGASNTYFEYNKGLLPQKNKIKRAIDKIQVLNETLEMAPRLAEYMSTFEKGGTKAEAMYNASEITTNFKRGGDITKAMNKYGANFLNASVQGLDKQIRNITGENGIKGYAQLVTRTAILGVLPSVINHLILDDDDEYQDLPDYIKDSYYLIPSNKEEDKFIRIPKGRVLATIGTTARNMLELAKGERDIEKSIKGSLESIKSNMAPNNPFADNIGAPIFQALSNKAWYGGEIESSRLQKLPVAERTDEKTDELSNKISEVLQSNSLTKYIADKLGISPKKINYVIDQYSGGIGDVLLPMATHYAETNIIEDKFTTSSILKNKNVEIFYTALENAELSNNSEYATDTDKLEYKYLNNISKDVGELYSKKRDIQNSNISDDEKKKQTKEIQSQINNIVKDTLNTLEDAKITTTTANFNKTQYYKDEEGKWKEIKEDDIPKGLSAGTYADYKNKLAIATDKKKKEEKNEDTTLTSKEKANILKTSPYTDKEKKEIYSEILGKQDDDYKYLSKLEDININAYLDYKIQEIKGDEDSSSDIVEKTKSGSKRNNLISYLNSSELSNLDKIYILGKSNKLTIEQGTILENVVNNSNLTSEEKKEFYKGLASSNVEELKDGNIRIKWRK